MKKIFVVILLLMTTFVLKAQNRQSIFVEGLGNGLFYTVNFDQHFSSSYNGLGLRIGAGVAKGSDYSLFVPMHLNYTFGGKRGFEVAAGATYQYIWDDYNSDSDKEGHIYPSGSLMYKFQSGDGFLFKIGVTSTFLEVDDSEAYHIPPRIFLVWPGISVGWTFD